MTREALGVMTEREVTALRFGLYARALAPAAVRDLDALATQLADEESPPTAQTLKRRRAVAREEVAQARIAQAAVREVLFLDAEDLD